MVSEVKESSNLWTIFYLFYGHYCTICSFTTMLHTKVQKFHVRNSFSPSKRGDTWVLAYPGSRNTSWYTPSERRDTAIHLCTSAHRYNPYGKREKGTGIPHKTGGHTRPRHLSTSAPRYNPYRKREKGTGIPHKTSGHTRPRHLNTSAHRLQSLWQKGKGYWHTSQDQRAHKTLNQPTPVSEFYHMYVVFY